MSWNDAVLAQWEAKWLDPEYDMARGKYRDDDEDDFVDDEIDDMISQRKGEKIC